jgi:DNA-binding protein Fis
MHRKMWGCVDMRTKTETARVSEKNNQVEHKERAQREHKEASKQVFTHLRGCVVVHVCALVSY